MLNSDSTLYRSALLSCLFMLSIPIVSLITKAYDWVLIAETAFVGLLITALVIGLKLERKELLKASMTSLLTALAFLGILMVFDLIIYKVESTLSMPFYAVISAILEGLICIAVFIIHLVVNSTRSSRTELVNINRLLMGILILLNIFNIIVYDVIGALDIMNTYIYLSECLASIFMLFFIICIEHRINVIRIKRENGTLIEEIR